MPEKRQIEGRYTSPDGRVICELPAGRTLPCEDPSAPEHSPRPVRWLLWMLDKLQDWIKKRLLD